MLRSICCTIILLTLSAPPAVAQSKLEQDLRFVNDNAVAVLIVRPAKMLEAPELALEPLADLAGPTGIKPSNVDRLVVTVVPLGAPLYELGALVHVKLKQPIDPEALRTKISPHAEKQDGYPFPTYDAQSTSGACLAFPTPNDIVLSGDGGIFYSALAMGVRTAHPKPKLVDMCGPDADHDLFLAAEFDRLVHAASFSRGRYNSQAARDLESYIPANTGRLRGRFDFDAKHSLSIDVSSVKPDEAPQFRDKVVTRKDQLINQALKITADLVQTRPDLREFRESFSNLVSNIEKIDTAAGCELRLNASLKPVDAWKNLLASIGLWRGYQQQQLVKLQGRRDLMRLIFGFHKYHDVHQKWPADVADKNGKPLLSWRVALLPYYGHQRLYKQFRLNEPWDSVHNKTLIDKMPADLAAPGTTLNGQTGIQKPVAGPLAKSIDDFIDGTSNTIALVTSSAQVTWTKPADHSVDLTSPWKNIESNSLFAFADGSVFRLDREVVGNKLANAITHAARDALLDLPDGTQIDSPNDKKELQVRLENAGVDAAVIRDLLNSRDPGEKAKAATINLLTSNDPFLVAFAMLAIESNEMSYNWEDLKRVLGSRYEFNRGKAIELMSRTGQAGVVQAIFRPGTADQASVWQCLHEHKLGEKFACKELMPLLKHKDPEHRIEAGWAIAVFGKKKHRDQIAALDNDPNELVRKACKEMLEMIDSSP